MFYIVSESTSVAEKIFSNHNSCLVCVQQIDIRIRLDRLYNLVQRIRGQFIGALQQRYVFTCRNLGRSVRCRGRACVLFQPHDLYAGIRTLITVQNLLAFR